MEHYHSSGLIEPDELAALLDSGANIKLVDSSYVLPGMGPPPIEEYNKARIGNAVFFDIDAIADRSTDLPHMLPTPAGFEKAVSELGIGDDDQIVVYDQTGITMASCRTWWTFRAYGHEKVSILNGGLPGWIAAGYEISKTPPPSPEPASYKSAFQPQMVKTMADVQTACSSQTSLIMDARSPARFSGKEAEPRPGLKRGAMPGAVNIPFLSLIHPESDRLKNKQELEKIFSAYDLDGEIITTCGSGVTACVINFALYHIGKKDTCVYDGSWAEWGQPELNNLVA